MATNLKQESSPSQLVDVVLHLGHNQSGHNGYQRTYAAIKHLYYWKGMREQILQYCKVYVLYRRLQFEKQIFEPGVQPMEFISMDLIGEFHPPHVTCINCCMYAYRLHILHTHQEQVGRGDSDSLEKSHCLSVWCLQKTTDGQWHWI